MKIGQALAVALVLLAGSGCRPTPETAEVFEAWEEGRTLIFENPTLPDGPPARTRFHERFQKQVVRRVDEDGGRRIETVFSTFKGRQTINVYLKDGGVSLLDPQGRQLLVLPKGFPERTATWQVPGYRMRVLGRARWEREQPAFPATRPPEGVWVEGEPLQGDARIRVFYLPDFGEVEKREWRDGTWVTTNLMVGWNFQEIPRAKADG